MSHETNTTPKSLLTKQTIVARSRTLIWCSFVVCGSLSGALGYLAGTCTRASAATTVVLPSALESQASCVPCRSACANQWGLHFLEDSTSDETAEHP